VSARAAVLGVDPGTRKCGYAVVAALGEAPAELGIASLEEFAAILPGLRERHAVAIAALGAGTHSAPIEAMLRAAGFSVTRVDEHETTLRARARYFQVHPPRGWRRLIPRGMLLPPRPVDDFAALLIAERYLSEPGSPT
jgi:RNase H-fold protein (predicted Holliday junction resolvase)